MTLDKWLESLDDGRDAQRKLAEVYENKWVHFTHENTPILPPSHKVWSYITFVQLDWIRKELRLHPSVRILELPDGDNIITFRHQHPPGVAQLHVIYPSYKMPGIVVDEEWLAMLTLMSADLPRKEPECNGR